VYAYMFFSRSAACDMMSDDDECTKFFS